MLHLALLIGILILACVISWCIARRKRITLALLPLLPGICALFYLGFLHQNRIFIKESSVGWVPSLGLNLVFATDGLSLLFALTVTFIGTLVFIYSAGYMKSHVHVGRYFSYMLLFTGAMLGVVTSSNLLQLYVFWELTTVVSYLLIGLESQKPRARSSAQTALLVTMFGGFSLLAGFVVIGQIVGSFDLLTVLESGHAIRSHPTYPLVLILVFIGAFAKSAILPFHFWLPSAMVAPTPVSAFLHSATMVNAGIFLLLRLAPALADTALWSLVLTPIGALTMLAAGFMAVLQVDLKRLLAFSTVSVLGMLVMSIGVDSYLSYKAVLLYIPIHALYKCALFMVAGNIQTVTGTRKIQQLQGLAWSMPLTAVGSVLAALSMSGVPPLIGFVGKELIYRSNIEAYFAPPIITAAGVAGNAFTVAIALLVGVAPFVRKAHPTRETHECPVSMWFPLAILAVVSLGLAFYIYPLERMVGLALGAIGYEQTPVELKLWHGLNLELVLSVATIFVGVSLVTGIKYIRQLGYALDFFTRFGPHCFFDKLLKWTLNFASWLTSSVQTGHLHHYLAVLFLSLVAAIGPLVFFPAINAPWDVGPSFSYELAILTLLGVSALVAVLNENRFVTLTAFALISFTISILYLFFSAPDLTMTQILVETLLVFLFVSVLNVAPSKVDRNSRSYRIFTGSVAIGVGLVVWALAKLATTQGTLSKVSSYYLDNAPAKGQGSNTVNVILTDFRAFDTFGEITILMLATLGIILLLAPQQNTTQEGK